MDTQYRHFRANLMQKDYTLCGVLNSKGHIMIGMAVCHPADGATKGDFFSKKTGRELSYTHAHTQPIAVLVINDGDSAEYTFHRYASSITPRNAFHRSMLQEVKELSAMLVA